ncbi:MAG: lytic transglycosylase domain-containing protein [Acidobacteria bacterium]|nr:lytic transglycosylase domain-containing protein [Acidobacteriota bacterium]
MKPKRARVRSAALATPLFLALSIQAVPSHPAIPRHLVSPAGDKALGRAQLATMLTGGARPWLARDTVSAADLNAALGARQRRFGLFRSESAVDHRREVLRRLPFGAILAAAGERNRIDSLLLAAVVETESRFAPHAVSPCGAVGLMQLLPSTGEDYGVKNLRDPYANIDAGSRYLRVLLERFNGRPDLALAAYNTGPEVIARYGCVPPYRETQDFVKRVLTRYDQHRQELARVSTRRPAPAPTLVAAAGGSSRREPAESRPEGEGLAR